MSEAAALQAALAGEHASVYAYGVVGAQLIGVEQEMALRRLAEHRAARDQLATLIRARGEVPPGPLPGYALPAPVSGPAAARALAAGVEDRLADVYGDLVEQAGDRTLRRVAAERVGQAAARAAGWSGRTQAFPGLLDPPG